MTWTVECILTLDDVTRWEKQQYEDNKPVREQVITAYEAQGPKPYWIAHLTSDPHFYAIGMTEEQTIGRLWLAYPSLIIEKCKALKIEKQQGGQQQQ